MRILLIYPLPNQRELIDPGWVPLGLSFIAAGLKMNGHVVSIFDRYAYQARVGIDRDKINRAMVQKIKDFKPDLIGLNTVSPLIYDTVQCAELIRSVFFGVLLAGGHHATALPGLTLNKIPYLDAVVAGEGEITMCRLANGEPFSKIPGVWCKEDETVKTPLPPEKIMELDVLPFPAMELLDMNFYTRPGTTMIRGHYLSVVSILASRGCVYSCEFCSESITYGSSVRFHSPDYVIEWIEQILKDYRVNGIYFHDNDFLLNTKWVREICEKMISRGLHRKIKWAIQARAERIKPEILRLLHMAGCVLIEIGVESDSQEVLDVMGKGSTIDINEQAIALCKKEGISVHAYMLTAAEGEVIQDLENRLKWLKKVKPSTFSWHPLELHPGTLLYERVGNDYYEQNEWNEENIRKFQRMDLLSAIPADERKKWMENNYSPYEKKYKRLHTIKVNSPIQNSKLVYQKLRRHIQEN